MLIATSNDDHNILHHQIGWYLHGEGHLQPQYRDPLTTHPIERTAEVERLDVVQCLWPASTVEHPEFVLVERRGVRAGE